MSDKAKLKSISFLVERYKKEIEKLKENDSFKDDKKLQTVSVLREVCQDLEYILNKKKIEFINQSCNESIAELEEKQKEDKYIHQKMKESLSMGSKAQSLAFIEAYRIIDNRVNAN